MLYLIFSLQKGSPIDIMANGSCTGCINKK